MRTYLRFLGAAAVGILGILALPACGADGSYKLLKEVPIGGEGGWDYLTVDPLRAPALRQPRHPGGSH